MTGRGRAARRPPAGWAAPARRNGLRVRFAAEDGQQHKWFDFAGFAGCEQIQGELADAFEAATGPLGGVKRVTSATNSWAASRSAAQWLAEHRPAVRSLAGLGRADARPLAAAVYTRGGAARVKVLRSLLRHSTVVTEEFTQALMVIPWESRSQPRQPYTDLEARRIATVARGIVRRARDRIRRSWAMVADYRAGRWHDRSAEHPGRMVAEMLDHCARTGDHPRSAWTGNATAAATRAAALVDGRGLNEMLHLTPGEAWAFAVLLTGLTGYNASMLAELPAAHYRATAPGEPGIAVVEVNKPRRGPRSAMTLPLDTVARAMRPRDDPRPARVQETSLNSAWGVYTLLLELTGPAREWLRTDRAFAYYATILDPDTGLRFRDGLPQIWRSQRIDWVRPWLTGDPERDELLLGISLDRLRKTYLEHHRRPVAHTPATLASYLRGMNVVTQEGFQIVREALDEQVEQALRRRRMAVLTHDAHPEAPTAGQDTVLGACTDFDHAPPALDHPDAGRGDDGNETRRDSGPCRRSFLDCLDCVNARALPRHLPMHLVVLDHLRSRQPAVPATQWVSEYAGRVAQLEDILSDYEPAQREQARTQITDHHRRLAARLFAGDLDPL